MHKQAGDTVLKDENLVDLETDKVVLEVPALSDGVLAEIIEPEGSTVLSGQLLARIEAGSAKPETQAQKQHRQNQNQQQRLYLLKKIQVQLKHLVLLLENSLLSMD